MADSDTSGEPAREAIERRLIERASADPEFRARLLSEPKAAMAEELGIEFPDQVAVEVLEERADKLYLVIPRRGDALTDEELEGVGGGGSFYGGSFWQNAYIDPNQPTKWSISE